jgi:hypothetical protein
MMFLTQTGGETAPIRGLGGLRLKGARVAVLLLTSRERADWLGFRRRHRQQLQTPRPNAQRPRAIAEKSWLRVHVARRSALFKTELFCLYFDVIAPDLGCVVQDYIQQ